MPDDVTDNTGLSRFEHASELRAIVFGGIVFNPLSYLRNVVAHACSCSLSIRVITSARSREIRGPAARPAACGRPGSARPAACGRPGAPATAHRAAATARAAEGKPAASATLP